MTTLLNRFVTRYNILTEDRASYIKTQMGQRLLGALKRDTFANQKWSIDQLIDALGKIDPTTNRQYLQWIATQYANGHFRLEDARRVRSAIDTFNKRKGELNQRDIGQYRTVADLESAVEDIQGEDHTSNKERIKLSKGEITDVLDTDQFRVLTPLTLAAAQIYGRGTKWCTTQSEEELDLECFTEFMGGCVSLDDDGDDTDEAFEECERRGFKLCHGTFFDIYTRKGPLYIIINKQTGRKWQLHIPTEQFMDERDQTISSSDRDLLDRDPELSSWLKKLGV